MESVAKRGEIIMDDETCYLVLKAIEYNNEVYLRAVKSGNHIFEETYPINIKEAVYLKEVVEDEDCFYDFIDDENLIKTLKTI